MSHVETSRRDTVIEGDDEPDKPDQSVQETDQDKQASEEGDELPNSNSEEDESTSYFRNPFGEE